MVGRSRHFENVLKNWPKKCIRTTWQSVFCESNRAWCETNRRFLDLPVMSFVCRSFFSTFGSVGDHKISITEDDRCPTVGTTVCHDDTTRTIDENVSFICLQTLDNIFYRFLLSVENNRLKFWFIFFNSTGYQLFSVQRTNSLNGTYNVEIQNVFFEATTRLISYVTQKDLSIGASFFQLVLKSKKSSD